jgi:hypothetical protein
LTVGSRVMSYADGAFQRPPQLIAALPGTLGVIADEDDQRRCKQCRIHE